MKSAFAVAILVCCCAAPVAAQTPGMSAMKYYVGSWSCSGGPIGQPPAKATTTYTLDHDVMHQWADVPAQGKIPTPIVISFDFTYDTKKHQYVQTSLDNTGYWEISVAKPWTGNTEQWTDKANSDNKLGHGTLVRTTANAYTFTGYPTLTSTKASFRVSCKRSS